MLGAPKKIGTALWAVPIEQPSRLTVNGQRSRIEESGRGDHAASASSFHSAEGSSISLPPSASNSVARS